MIWLLNKLNQEILALAYKLMRNEVVDINLFQ